MTRVANVSVVVLTFNEERNLAACLESLVGWTREVILVDSGSTDATLQIAASFGARVVVHPFESHAAQWAWALSQLTLQSEWVLALDADQRVTPELRDDLTKRLERWQAAPQGAGRPSGAADSTPCVGGYLNRRQIFRGRWIRHGGYYPKYLLKLFRRDAVRLDAGDLVDHHFEVAGATELLSGDLIEDNRNESDISTWIAKHNRYAVLQAREELARWGQGRGLDGASPFGTPDARTRWRKNLWNRLPLFVRPAAYFFYRYVVRLGFLDGKEGFIFHFLQAFWYRLLVDINRDELARQAPPADTRQ